MFYGVITLKHERCLKNRITNYVYERTFRLKLAKKGMRALTNDGGSL